MLPIYICEDDKRIRNYLVEQMQKYIMIQDYDMEIFCATANPHELLDNLSEQKQAIYFLDIDLNHQEYDGFKLAKEIRKHDDKGFIIFVTTYGELAFETFRLHLEAMDYIVKDQVDIVERMRYCLDVIQTKITNDKSNIKVYYTVKSNDRLYNLLVDDILYFETSSTKHRLIVHAEEEILEFSGSLNEVEAKLTDDFIRIHRSYFVNRHKIAQINLKENLIELVNGEICPVARRMKKKLLKLE